jgi:general secretion pathway protein G
MTAVRRRRPSRRGFTLMEVLLVLAILVVLGSIVTVSVFRMQVNAYRDSARTQIKSFETAIQAYQLDVGQLPRTLEDLNAPPGDLPNPAKWKGPYFDKQIPLDPWDRQYSFEADESGYLIASSGPNGIPNDEDDVSSAQ